MTDSQIEVIPFIGHQSVSIHVSEGVEDVRTEGRVNVLGEEGRWASSVLSPVGEVTSSDALTVPCHDVNHSYSTTAVKAALYHRHVAKMCDTFRKPHVLCNRIERFVRNECDHRMGILEG